VVKHIKGIPAKWKHFVFGIENGKYDVYCIFVLWPKMTRCKHDQNYCDSLIHLHAQQLHNIWFWIL